MKILLQLIRQVIKKINNNIYIQKLDNPILHSLNTQPTFSIILPRKYLTKNLPISLYGSNNEKENWEKISMNKYSMREMHILKSNTPQEYEIKWKFYFQTICIKNQDGKKYLASKEISKAIYV